MRGDSLRDLYAKALAVVGLGLLAVIGALVDYWPTGIRYPALAGALAPPAAPLLQQADAHLTDIIDAHARAVAAAARSASPVLADRALPEAPLAVASTVSALGGVVALSSLPAGRSATVPDATLLSEPVATLARAEDASTDEGPIEIDYVPYNGLESVTMAAVDYRGASDDERGFVADALHKTRTSIVRTGRWTGSSLVGAARVVSTAVRRALPN